MSPKDAYKIIGKHLFSAVHPYNAQKIIIILADNLDNATKKAREFFNSRFVSACELVETEDDQIYTI